MSKNAMDNFTKNIEFAKKYCAENRMILVRIDVPPRIYSALKERCYTLEQMHENPKYNISHFDIEQFCGASIGLNRDIKKPQYIMEMSNDEF